MKYCRLFSLTCIFLVYLCTGNLQSIEIFISANNMILANDVSGIEQLLQNNSLTQSELLMLKQQITTSFSDSQQSHLAKKWKGVSHLINPLITLILLIYIKRLISNNNRASIIADVQLGINERADGNSSRNICVSELTAYCNDKYLEHISQMLGTDLFKLPQSFFINEHSRLWNTTNKVIREKLKNQTQRSEELIILSDWTLFQEKINGEFAKKIILQLTASKKILGILQNLLATKLSLDLIHLWKHIKKNKIHQKKLNDLEKMQFLIEEKLKDTAQ